MINIVNSLKKNQKTVVLIAALGIIALYLVPVDQLVNAVTGTGDGSTPPNSSNDKVKENCEFGQGDHSGHCYRITG